MPRWVSSVRTSVTFSCSCASTPVMPSRSAYICSAADILENSELPAMKKARYASFDSGIGKDFEDGKLTFEQVYEYGKKIEEPKQTSGKQEKYETIVALYAK